MSDQTIFGTNPNPEATPPNQLQATGTPASVQIDPAIATLLDGIKNERGEPKYKSLHDAIVALQHSQAYIPQLTTQIAERDRELETARAAAARVAELERSVLELTQRKEPEQTTTVPGLTAEQVAELVQRTLSDKEAATKAQLNTAQVADALRAAFGTEAEAKYNAQAQELGMTVAELNALTARSPQAVLKMFNVTATKPNVAATSSSINTTGIQPHQDTFVGRNKSTTLIGATTADLNRESDAAKKMVEELHAQGKSVYDLTDPKVYKKFFG